MTRFLIAMCAMLATRACLAAERPSRLEIQVISGDEAVGSASNSILILGEHDAFVVDTQRTVANAQRVVQAVKDSGRSLKAIFLTHAHPDHVLGASVIQAAFPKAELLAIPSVAAEIRAKGEAMRRFVADAIARAGSPDGVPDQIAVPRPFADHEFHFEGHVFLVEQNGPGETETSAFIHIPDMKALIAGDLVYNKVHPFLAEADAEGWVSSLKALAATPDIETIYPGHGQAARPAVIGENIRYVETYERALATASSEKSLVDGMRESFPDYRMERFLAYGAHKNFERAWRIESEYRFQLGYYRSPQEEARYQTDPALWRAVASLGFEPEGQPELNIPVKMAVDRGFSLPYDADPAQLTYYMKFFEYPPGLNPSLSAGSIVASFLLDQMSQGARFEELVREPRNVAVKTGEIRKTGDTFKDKVFPPLRVPRTTLRTGLKTGQLLLSPQEYLDSGLFYATIAIRPGAGIDKGLPEAERIKASTTGLLAFVSEIARVYSRSFVELGVDSKDSSKHDDERFFLSRESCLGKLPVECRLVLYRVPRTILVFDDARTKPRPIGPKHSFASGFAMIERTEFYAPRQQSQSGVSDLAQLRRNWRRGPSRILEVVSLVQLDQP